MCLRQPGGPTLISNCESGKKRAHKLKKNPRDTGRVSLGHPAGQTGVYRPVSRGLPVIYYRKRTEKGIFAWTPAGCPRDTRPSRRFSENLCDFFLCAFSAPYAKSTHHPHKIDDQHCKCKIGGGAYFALFLGSDNSHTTPPKIPPDKEGLLWGWCVVRGPL